MTSSSAPPGIGSIERVRRDGRDNDRGHAPPAGATSLFGRRTTTLGLGAVLSLTIREDQEGAELDTEGLAEKEVHQPPQESPIHQRVPGRPLTPPTTCFNRHTHQEGKTTR